MTKEDRGFASMDREKRREIASKGGQAAHKPGLRTNGKPKKKPHEWDTHSARSAGRKSAEKRFGCSEEVATVGLEDFFLPEV